MPGTAPFPGDGPTGTVRPMGEAGGERRSAPTAFRLTDGLPVDVLVPLGGGDHVVLPGEVTDVAGSTVTVRMDDGVAALTVATTRRCVVVWGDDGDETAALVRAGRRVDDVDAPTTIELVLEDVRRLVEPRPATT